MANYITPGAIDFGTGQYKSIQDNTGNAALITAYSSNSSLASNSSNRILTKTTPLWLQSVQTSSTLQFDETQLKSGVSYIPIRRNEQFLIFSVVWPLRRFNEMEDFSFSIRQHYNANLNQSQLVPMTLIYYKNNLTFRGWIRQAQRGAIRFQDLYTRTFQMELIMPTNGQAASTQTQSYSSFAPTNKVQEEYGTGWYNISNSQKNKSTPIVNLPTKNKK